MSWGNVILVSWDWCAMVTSLSSHEGGILTSCGIRGLVFYAL